MAVAFRFMTRWCAVLSLTLLGAAEAPTETLKETLAAKHLPLEGTKLANLDKNITSWAELNDENQYVIAYYVDDGSGLINSSLFLERYNRKSAEWKSGELPEARVKAEEKAEEMDICLGSVLSVAASGDRLFLETHINPSAGCVLIVSDDLKLYASLYGWVVGRLGEDKLIYHRSQIHFAPVHPAEIALYDLRTKRDVRIFPPKPESAIRRSRTAQLQSFYKRNEEWCRKNDDPCDPESFDSELGEKIATNETEAALAFVISYEQIQLVEGAVQKPSGPKDVLYIYRGVNDDTKMEYREMLLEDAKTQYGVSNLQNLVQPEILKKIFSDPSAK